MKIIKQIGIIFTVCWVSLVIEKILPFAFPASVIGMILLLICLMAGILKMEHIQDKADFLLENICGDSVYRHVYDPPDEPEKGGEER